MAKFSAKGAQILIDSSGGTQQDVSTDVVSYEIEEDAGAIEVTGFSDGSKNYIPGLPVVGITFEFLYDTNTTSGATGILRGILNSNTSKTVSIKPESAGTSLGGEFMLDNISVSATPAGEIKLGSCHFSVMGATKPTWA